MPDRFRFAMNSRVEPFDGSVDVAGVANAAGRNGVNELTSAPNSVPKFARLNTLKALNEGSMFEPFRQFDGPSQRGADLAEDPVAHRAWWRRLNKRLQLHLRLL